MQDITNIPEQLDANIEAQFSETQQKKRKTMLHLLNQPAITAANFGQAMQYSLKKFQREESHEDDRRPDYIGLSKNGIWW